MPRMGNAEASNWFVVFEIRAIREIRGKRIESSLAEEGFEAPHF